MDRELLLMIRKLTVRCQNQLSPRTSAATDVEAGTEFW